MPQLRFNKDKRGYENTYIVQPSRGRGKGRTRILYWFRTPPGVRVGRAALDEEAIRLIEASNPDVEFDWTRILKGQGDQEITPGPDRRERRPERERQASRPSGDRRPTRPADAPPAKESRADRASGDQDRAATQESTAGLGGPMESIAVPDEPMTAAHARLGFEGLVRLRARYGETMARITERIPGGEEQLQLKVLAERLNPDAWVTDADVSAGLESYERTYESLRGSIGNRRRNPRPEAGESE